MPIPEMKVHYIAEVTVKRVTNVAESLAGGFPNQGIKPAKREVVTVGRVTISDPTLEKLIERTSMHLGLIEDGGDIDNGKTTRG